ncbi:lactococcin 972 family bacteriocin [Aerococcaceae bacterium zg-BR9]|uniref:lactococcin 972 family bacteriocin n=1 Tax=Aerococcaceae bacterium zg-1292 TaxID=2774330 RepID=UPI0040638174|nr:lactococcin 972 family bacteriocin [Aerococcaceae bacterium zg-BR9]
MLKVKEVLGMVLVILIFSITIPVLVVSHYGGEWTYGGHHDPNNWGAFSNYYHGTSWHWSYVGSASRNHQRTAYADARSTSYAFINTDI